MEQTEWDDLFRSLGRTRDLVTAWTPEPPNPAATRCEHSRHRTLAHLRACQEQWMDVVDGFLSREKPSITILHPWRKFDQGAYAELSWETHLEKFLTDRERWLRWQDTADRTRSGKMNRKDFTVGDLASRLANHESYHVELVNI